MRVLYPILAFVLTLAFSHPATAVSVENAWVITPSPGATEAVAYVDIDDAAGDRLLGVSCDCAAHVHLHEMSMRGGLMTMRPLEGITIPEGGLHMGHTGAHIMLSGLSATLREGDQVQLRLIFQSAGEIAVSASVRTH